jgi:hypothetical protein
MSWTITPQLKTIEGIPWEVIPAARKFTPANITTALWLDAADASTITLNGSTVSQWNDKSGNGRHATQGTTAAQPTRTLSGLNSRTVLTFNGVDGGSIMSTTWNLSNNFSMFAVAIKNTQTSDPATGIRPLVAATSTGGKALGGIGTLRVGLSSPLINAVDFVVDPTRITSIENSWPDNQVRLISSTYDGATLTGWVDGSSYSVPAAVANSNFGIVQIGGTNDFTQRRFAGNLAETVIVSSVVNTSDRQKLEGYLAHKWGLTANLPADHPYKVNPPAP